MNDFTKEELQLISFLCLERKHSIGIDEALKEGTAALYKHVCDLIKGYKEID